jgi:hypothetical protein
VSAPITWAQATSPILWSNIGINWNTPAVTGDPTFALSQGYPSSGAAAYPSSATFTVNSGYTSSSAMTTTGSATYAVGSGLTSSGGFNLAAAAAFASTMDYSSSATHNAAGVATFAATIEYVNNTNHADSTTFGVITDYSSSSGFLWNDVDDVTTTWTDVDYPN